MPTSWGDKRERQYKHIKESLQKRGKGEKDAKRIAAATVNKQRAKSGETKKCDDPMSMSKGELAALVHVLAAASTKQSDNQERIMSKSDLHELFKSELGGDELAQQPLTKCIHCEKPLTKSDLLKGFVAEDNDQPSSGGKGQVESSRAGAGVEAQAIAPLLKGQDAGDDEQFLISKAEMVELGFDVSDLQGASDASFIITKGELVALKAEHCVPSLRKKKANMGANMEPAEPMKKSTGKKPTVIAVSQEKKLDRVSKSKTDGPQGLGGMAHGPGGAPLIQWVNSGDDEAIAKSIAEGAFGPGSDDPVKTQGSGLG